MNRRIMLQGESLTELQQVFEERSVQLLNQEERIQQRDDLLTKASERGREREGILVLMIAKNLGSSFDSRIDRYDS